MLESLHRGLLFFSQFWIRAKPQVGLSHSKGFVCFCKRYSALEFTSLTTGFIGCAVVLHFWLIFLSRYLMIKPVGEELLCITPPLLPNYSSTEYCIESTGVFTL